MTQERPSESTSKDATDKSPTPRHGSAGPPMDYADAAVEPLPMSMGDAQPRPRPPEGPSRATDPDAGSDPTADSTVPPESPRKPAPDSD
jgi:hypothetical protein